MCLVIDLSAQQWSLNGLLIVSMFETILFVYCLRSKLRIASARGREPADWNYTFVDRKLHAIIVLQSSVSICCSYSRSLRSASPRFRLIHIAMIRLASCFPACWIYEY